MIFSKGSLTSSKSTVHVKPSRRAFIASGSDRAGPLPRSKLNLTRLWKGFPLVEEEEVEIESLSDSVDI